MSKLLRWQTTLQLAGVLGGAFVVPTLLVAVANYSMVDFVGTYLATLPVAGVLLWLTGQWRPRLPWPKRGSYG